jgi:hypothetical protein
MESIGKLGAASTIRASRDGKNWMVPGGGSSVMAVSAGTDCRGFLSRSARGCKARYSLWLLHDDVLDVDGCQCCAMSEE